MIKVAPGRSNFIILSTVRPILTLLLHTDSLHCCCYTHPCLLLPTSEHTADGLLPCLATDLGLDALVLLLGNLFAHLPIAGISAQNVRVEDGDAPERDAHRLSKEVLECPRNAAHEDVECEAPNGIEEKSKIHGNHHAEEFQLRFQDANKKTSARGVDGQNPHCRRGKRDHGNNLLAVKNGVGGWGQEVSEQMLFERTNPKNK